MGGLGFCPCCSPWQLHDNWVKWYLTRVLSFEYFHYSDDAICTYNYTEEGNNIVQPYGLTRVTLNTAFTYGTIILTQPYVSENVHYPIALLPQWNYWRLWAGVGWKRVNAKCQSPRVKNMMERRIWWKNWFTYFPKVVINFVLWSFTSIYKEPRKLTT